MSYTRVTETERSQIYVLRQAGKGNNEIARIIGRDKGTVSREVRRNKGLRGYRHQQAKRGRGVATYGQTTLLWDEHLSGFDA